MIRQSEPESQLRLRLKQDLRVRLEEAAQRSGRSLNAELVARLEETFRENEPSDEEIEDEAANALSAVLAQTIYSVGPQAGAVSTRSVKGSKTWFDNSFAYDQVRRAVSIIMGAFRPEGPTQISEFAPGLSAETGKKRLTEGLDQLGDFYAQSIVTDIATIDDVENPPAETPHWMTTVRRLRKPSVALPAENSK
jgi:hypothetical protein